MTDHEHSNDETSEDREDTLKDLDVPDDEGKDVKGGAYDIKENQKI